MDDTKMSHDKEIINWIEKFSDDDPISCLSPRTRLLLNDFLIIDEDISLTVDSGWNQDIRGLSNLYEFRQTGELNVFRIFNAFPESPISTLLLNILDLERYDILNNSKFIASVDDDVFQSKQKKNDKSNRSKQVKPKDTMTDLRRQKWDAYVAYPENSIDFIYQHLVPNLEKEYNAKLYIHDRDANGGDVKTAISAEFINECCSYVLVIVTKDFKEDEFCEYIVDFTMSLSPGGRRKKIVPMLIERCDDLPLCLEHLTKCKFYEAKSKWFWYKIAKSIGVDVDLKDYDDFESLSTSSSPSLYRANLPASSSSSMLRANLPVSSSSSMLRANLPVSTSSSMLRANLPVSSSSSMLRNNLSKSPSLLRANLLPPSHQSSNSASSLTANLTPSTDYLMSELSKTNSASGTSLSGSTTSSHQTCVSTFSQIPSKIAGQSEIKNPFEEIVTEAGNEVQSDVLRADNHSDVSSNTSSYKKKAKSDKKQIQCVIS